MKTIRKGFTLVEMLVVIGIVMVLMGASVAGYSSMTKSAEKTKARELVSNVTTALVALYQREGSWPKPLITGNSGEHMLNEKPAFALGRKGYLSLSMEKDQNGTPVRLNGYDKFGIVTPWAVTVIKSRGKKVDLSTKIGSKSLQEHILRYAIDDDGDGFTEVPEIGNSSSTKVRATACVWCCSKDGSFRKNDVIKSWTPGMEVRE